MGATISRYRDVKDSEQLARFVSDENLEGNDAFFEDLLRYNLKPTRNEEDLEDLEAATESTIKEFVENNSTTKNLNHLIANILTHQVKESDEALLWRAFNGLNLVNYIIKSVIKEDENIDLIEVFGNLEDLTSFANYLLDNLIEIEVTPQTYHILLVSTTLLVSILMYSSTSIKTGNKIIPKLLQKYISQQPAPVFPFGQTSGIGFTLASGMWSVMTVGMSSLAEKPDPAYRPLATLSLALLLFLTKRNCDNTANENREILARLSNNDVNLSDLHYTLLTQMNYEGSDQLFQRLLVENFFYRRFVVVATDLSSLILPLLHSIYQRSPDNKHEVEKSITILRILSMDDLFCQAVHSSSKVNAGQVAWYKDKSISNMTLGGFVIIVLLRAILQTNITAPKEFMHKHYLTVLSNMSGHFRHLSPYVSERIISTIETLRRKQVKLNNGDDINSGELVEEVFATLLFLTNNCLVLQTEYNPNLIYTLLYKKDILENFGDSKLVKSLTDNFKSIITFVSDKIEKQTTIVGRGLQPEEVLLIASKSGQEFPKEKWNKISILNAEEEAASHTTQEESKLEDINIEVATDIVKECIETNEIVEDSAKDEPETISEELIQLDVGTCNEQANNTEDSLVGEDIDKTEEESEKGKIDNTLVDSSIIPETPKEEFNEVGTLASGNEPHLEVENKIQDIDEEETIVKQEDNKMQIRESEASVDASRENNCVEEQKEEEETETEVLDKVDTPASENEPHVDETGENVVELETETIPQKEEEETETEVLDKVDTPALENGPHVDETGENVVELETETIPQKEEEEEETETEIIDKVDTPASENEPHVDDIGKNLVELKTETMPQKEEDETEKEVVDKGDTPALENEPHEEVIGENVVELGTETVPQKEEGETEKEVVDKVDTPALENESHAEDISENLVDLETETMPQKEEDKTEKEVVDKMDTPASENEPHAEDIVENLVELETETIPQKEEDQTEKEILDKVDTPASENEPHAEDIGENLVELETETMPQKEEDETEKEKEVEDKVNTHALENEPHAEDIGENLVDVETETMPQKEEDETEKEVVDKGDTLASESEPHAEATGENVVELETETIPQKEENETEKEVVDKMDTPSLENEPHVDETGEKVVELETEIIPQKEEDEIEKEVVDKVDTPALESEPHAEETSENMVELETETMQQKEEAETEKEDVDKVDTPTSENELQAEDIGENLVDLETETMPQKEEDETENEVIDKVDTPEKLNEATDECKQVDEEIEVAENKLDNNQILEEEQIILIENSSEESIAEVEKEDNVVEKVEDLNVNLAEVEEPKTPKHMEKKIIIKESVQVASHEIVVKDDVLEIVSIQDIKKLATENAPILTNVQSCTEKMSEENIEICQTNSEKETDDKDIEQKLSLEKVSENENTLIDTSQYENVTVESITDDTIENEHQTLCVSGSITNDDKKSSVTFIIDGDNLHGKIFDKNIKIIVKDFIIVEDSKEYEESEMSTQSQETEENITITETNNAVINVVEDNKTIESEDDIHAKEVKDTVMGEVDVIEKSNDIGELDVNAESSVMGETPENSDHHNKTVPDIRDTSLVVEDSENEDKPVTEEIVSNDSSMMSEGPEKIELGVNIVSEVELEISVPEVNNEIIVDSDNSKIEEFAETEIIHSQDLNKNEEEISEKDIKIAFTNETSEERDMVVENNTAEESTLATEDSYSSEPLSETPIAENNEITNAEITETATKSPETPSDNNVNENDIIVELNIPSTSPIEIQVTEKIDASNDNLDHLNKIEDNVDSSVVESNPQTQISDEGYTSEKSAEQSADEQDEVPDEVVPKKTKRVQPVPIHNAKSLTGAAINVPFKDIQIDSLATNLSLGGSQIKFELFSHMRIKPVVNASPQAKIVWQRTDSNKM